MEKKGLVTIITPCYNGEAFLDGYFKAILNQTYENIELIFINDGSTDDTENIALKYGEVFQKKGVRFKYVYQENGGQARAMNAGLPLMEGEFLIWPDSDDLLSPDSIEKKVDFFKKNPEYSFVRTNGYFFDYETKENLYRISNLESRFKEDIFLDLILEHTYCCCGCYMIKSKVLKEFYPNLKIFESSAGQNWQILIPISGKYKCGFIDEDLYFIAVRKDSHSRCERNVDELISRYGELKKILEETISISGRKDKDYNSLVETKYHRIYMHIYLENNCLEQARDEYCWLKSRKELTAIDKRMYIEKTHLLLYKFYIAVDLIKRVKNKLKRILLSSE